MEYSYLNLDNVLKGRARRGILLRAFVFFGVLLLAYGCVFPQFVSAQDDLVKFLEKKKIELSEKEEALKREEARLNAIKKDVDERIAEYNKLLDKIEDAIKTLDAQKNERIDHLVKTYEAMPNEEAAIRLSSIDETTAVRIISKMKTKKAGAVIAAMEPSKAASISMGMVNATKKFPTK